MKITKAQKERVAHLVLMLNEACRRYYVDTDNGPAMSDSMYDKMLAELKALEEKTGVQLPDSPTRRVGFNEDGDKIQHTYPILSLKDTKSTDDLLRFIKDEPAVLSWKLDGISIVLYYKDGHLDRALSRGDGHWGKDITRNILLMRYIPTKIKAKGDVIIRGEGCLSLKEFNQLKQTKEGERYSNPRNLAAGLVNATKTSSILLRHMSFIAHSAILLSETGARLKTRDEQLRYMTRLGFNVVPYSIVANYELLYEVESYTKRLEDYDFPVDGLVLTLNDISLGESLGSTARFPRHSMAFKWPDEHKDTRVTGMKWSVSGTGLITPVVIFEPVALEGTMVKQANLHNLKFFEDLAIGVGDILRVYKANKIIPEVEENFTRSVLERYPKRCPVCKQATEVVISKDKNDKVVTKKLYCRACGEK